ncbi:formylglycine-generating enzyme family protein [Candidatus Falkowbacteria bacterium]|nr:formylglycine-generating enzyme family protein [Candidatus Falkowbacteria bacterium]
MTNFNNKNLIFLIILVAVIIIFPGCVKKTSLTQQQTNQTAFVKTQATKDSAIQEAEKQIPENMVLVKGGTFDMGDWMPEISLPEGTMNIKDPTDKDMDGKGVRGGDLTFDARDIHKVSLDDYYISKHEVTFEEFDQFCNETDKELKSDEGWGRGNLPAINVTWLDAIEYCNWLSEKQGFEKVYEINGYYDVTADFSKNGYRLPTEAEWEYAARGGHLLNKNLNNGKGNIYSGCSDYKTVGDCAWYQQNSDWVKEPEEDGHTSTVMTLQPNELEIYDMSGNVWEWVWDYYSPDYYKESPKQNPTGPAEIVEIDGIKYIGHVLRGGSWGNVPLFIKTTFRFFSLNQTLTENVDYTNWRVGFRVCKNVD